MVQMIVGKKGKGKTKHLLDQVNTAIKEANGTIDYLDKSTKHMFELNNKIRLIDVSSYPLKNYEEFIGFICGIISQDRDVEKMYLDSFLKLSHLEADNSGMEDCINQLEKISNDFKVDFILSVSMDREEIPAGLEDKIALAL